MELLTQKHVEKIKIKEEKMREIEALIAEKKIEIEEEDK